MKKSMREECSSGWKEQIVFEEFILVLVISSRTKIEKKKKKKKKRLKFDRKKKNGNVLINVSAVNVLEYVGRIIFDPWSVH